MKKPPRRDIDERVDQNTSVCLTADLSGLTEAERARLEDAAIPVDIVFEQGLAILGL